MAVFGKLEKNCTRDHPIYLKRIETNIEVRRKELHTTPWKGPFYPTRKKSV